MEPLRDRSGERDHSQKEIARKRKLQWSRCVIAAESDSGGPSRFFYSPLQWSRCVIAAESSGLA